MTVITTLQCDGFIVNIIKSKRRKTMALKVDAKGVSAHIPTSLPIATAKQFIEQKTAWVQKKLVQQAQRTTQEKQFINGESFLFLNEPLTLRLYDANKKVTVNKSGDQLEIFGRLNKLSKPAIRAAIIDWYKPQANSYIKSRTQLLSKQYHLFPHTITVKTYKARWGSCSIKGDINFNWQLIQAPPEVIDYVIIHELCHLEHHNHSAHFWQLVDQCMPNFKIHRQWLKDNAHTISL